MKASNKNIQFHDVSYFFVSIFIGFLWTAISPFAGFAVSSFIMLIGALTLTFSKNK